MAQAWLDWAEPRCADWQLLLTTARAALHQGWSYGEALRASGVPVQRLILREPGGRALACAQIAVRRPFRLLRAVFLLRGPVWLDAPARAELEPVLIAGIRQRFPRTALVWAPEAVTAHAPRPVMTGYSTAWLDVSADPGRLRGRLAADWRNALRRAEQHPLEVRSAGTPASIDWLLDRNEAYRRQVGYHGPSRAFLGRLAHAAAAGGELLLLVAHAAGEPVAGVMIVRHGAAATYEVGYVAPRGRELRATHLLLWRATGLLAAQGVRWLDLGGIATDRSPGIARFKLGLGGEIMTLAGTFLL